MKKINELNKKNNNDLIDNITENREIYNEESQNNKKIVKSSNKLIINLTVFISILIMSFGIIFFYPKIKTISNNEKRTPYEDYDLLEDINNCSFILYKDIVEKQSGSEKSLEEIYIKSYSNNYEEYENYELETSDDYDKKTIFEESVLNPLQSKIYRLQAKLNYDLKNLDYAAIDKDGNVIINRGLENIGEILSQNQGNFESLKDSYGFYVVINYDSNGYPQIKDYYGTDFSYIRNIFTNNKISKYLNSNNEFKVTYNNIKDTTIVYGIPKELKYDDSISDIVENMNGSYISKDTIMIFGFIVGCIVLFLGFILPYKFERKIIGFNRILKMPFEVGCIFYGTFSFILIMSALGMITVSLTRKSEEILRFLGVNSTFNNILIYLCNVLLWSVIIYFILSGVTYLKNIFQYGFKKYWSEKVIVVRSFRYFVRKAEDGLNYLNHIDLSNKSNKIIIKVLLINFIVLSAISIIWVFGIFAAIVYNIILFVLIRKYCDKVRNDYSNLLNATNRIAEGNLDTEISEDLGLFNHFKDELKKIQSGFKKAVNEEVKSQKMKTELISNVSHDLKTPLTSIITYIDLLKNDNASYEERKSYIDTIDKKAQRLKFLIEDLFEVSKATSGNIKLKPVNVDIIELIRQVEIELYDKLDNAKIVVKNNFPDNKILLKLDSQKTFRIFENLLNNVAKYSMAGSRVYVDISENDQIVKINIKNMSSLEIDYKPDEIIERFQRGDKSRNTEGSGLGLAIVKSFVEAQGGIFKIELDGDLFKAIVIFTKQNNIY